jgi:hypothetical protein
MEALKSLYLYRDNKIDDWLQHGDEETFIYLSLMIEIDICLI